MAKSKLDSAQIGLFCESVAEMLAAGIQTDEAVGMLAEDVGDATLRAACELMYRRLNEGCGLARAMRVVGVFPRYAVDMAGVGEDAGRLEEALRALGVYYDEEDRLFSKIRSAVGYPAALLCVMSIILAFAVAVILPVFEDVYVSIAGSLTGGSFSAVGLSVVIGWAALMVTLACAVVALAGVVACRSAGGRAAVLWLFERLPETRAAMEKLAASRFASVLAAYTAAGANTEAAMKEAIDVTENARLRQKADAAYALMVNTDAPRSLAQAISEAEVFEQVHARMLAIGTRTGSLDAALDRLSANFFDEAILRIDAAVDNIEPALAALLTIAVGATLISVMMPLIGIMGSIG